MKLTRTLRILLGAQFIMYLAAVQIAYSSSHDNVSDLSGLGALFPLAIFLALSCINFPLIVAYIVRYIRKGPSFDIAIAILLFINILAVVLYGVVFDWAASGPT